MIMMIKDVFVDCDLCFLIVYNFSFIFVFDLVLGKFRSCVRGDKGYFRRLDKERVWLEVEGFF